MYGMNIYNTPTYFLVGENPIKGLEEKGAGHPSSFLPKEDLNLWFLGQLLQHYIKLASSVFIILKSIALSSQK